MAELSQGKKFLIDLFPLAAFFATNWLFPGTADEKFFWAIGILMAATLISLVITYFLTRKISKMLLFTAVMVMVFGGLTLYLHDKFYAMIKVTIINVLFAGILFGGLYFRKNLIKSVMGQAVELPDAAWRTLTIRWALFFLCLAAINEFIRNVTPDYWVSFKAFGILGLTLLFAIANAPYMARFMNAEESKKIPSAD